MAEGPLEEAVGGRKVDIEWMPFELRPYPNERLKPEDDYLQQGWKNNVYPTAARMGVKMVLPRVSPQPYTHLAFEGFQYAREHGAGNRYNHRIFTAFFQEERNIGDGVVLTELAGELGLDPAGFKKALDERLYKDVHQRLLQHAYYEARITVVPTFVIGARVLRGLYDAATLRDIIDTELGGP